MKPLENAGGWIIAVFVTISVALALIRVLGDSTSSTSTNFYDMNDSWFYNETLTGSIGVPLTLSGVDSCQAVSFIVNGSVDAYAVDPVQFSFSASSTPFSVAQCILWTNLTGSWASNESNDVFFPSTDGNFNLTLEISNKAYVWGVFCNDTSGVGEYSSNNTLLMTQGVLQ